MQRFEEYFRKDMAAKGKYPVLKNDEVTRPQCVVCKLRCGEPGEFLMLSAGAVLYDDESRMTGGPDDLMSGYLYLVKHGAEPDGPYVKLDLMRDLIGGQGDLLFCSAACMRNFFESAVDELERHWADER